MSGDRVRRLAPWVAAFAAYSLLTIPFTWPLALHVRSAFPHDAGDPAFTTWVLWWNAHAMPLTARWWNAPIFWPAADMFALSEHMLGISLFATPLQWAGASPLAAFNVMFLLSFPLSAAAAHGLAYAVTKRHDAALVAAVIFGFSPYRVSQLPHLQMLWAFGMPLALAALHAYLETHRTRWLIVFGGAWLLAAIANGYYLLFFSVLLGCWILWFVVRGSRAYTMAIAATFAVASLPLVPLLVGYQHVHSRLSLERGIGEIEQFSADMTAVAAASPSMTLWHGLSRWSRPEGELFPGALALLLAAAGAVVAVAHYRRLADRPPDRLRAVRHVCAGIGAVVAAVALSPLAIGAWRIGSAQRPILSVASPAKPLSIAILFLTAALVMTPMVVDAWRRRSTSAFYSMALVLMLILSFGPRPRLAGTPVLFRAPYAWLMELPGFSGVRVPARFGMLFVLCVAVAASLAFARLTRAMRGQTRTVLAALAVLVIIAESWPRLTFAAEPEPIAALARTSSPGAVLELPLGITARDIAAVYRSIDHRRPIVNGYSGYEPPHYVALKLALDAGDQGVLDEIAGGAPLTIAVDHREQPARWSALVERHPRHRLVSDDGTWRIYEISPPAPTITGIAGGRLSIASITANLRAGDARFATDGNLRTLWNAGQLQAGNEEVTIDLGRARDVTAIRLELGPYRYDFPRALEVDCAAEGGAWDPCWRGSTAALAVRGLLDDPAQAPMTVRVDRGAVRRIRLRQTAVDHLNGWSIAELTVFGR